MKKYHITLPIILLLLLFAISYLPLKFRANAVDFTPEIIEAKNLYYKDSAKSLEKFQEILRQCPDNVGVRLDVIRLLREFGNYQEAMQHLNILLETDPENSEYRLNMIQTAFLAGKPQLVIELTQNRENLSAAEYFWQGAALIDLGKETAAIESLVNSLNLEPFNPQANLILGDIYYKFKQYRSAEQYYRKALSQDHNLTSAYFPLAKSYIALENYPAAYRYLSNAKRLAPWNKEIEQSLQNLVANHSNRLNPPAVPTPTPSVSPIPEIVPIMVDRDKIPIVRIGLAENITTLRLKPNNRFKIEVLGKSISKTGEAQNLVVKYSGKKIHFYNSKGQLLLSSAATVRLSFDNPATTTLIYNMAYGKGTFWAGQQDRRYRGNFDFIIKPSGFTVVNRLNIEEYLYGVVPAEIPSHWPKAALESQAVAARTYTLANMGSFASRGFDLLPTVSSQVYTGVIAERATTNAAVNGTRGIILTYNDKPINAFYTGNNGGYSASSYDLWKMNRPYLKGVPDKLVTSPTEPWGPEELATWLTTRPETYSSQPQYSSRSAFRWVLWVPREEIEFRLKQGNKLGKIKSITITKRSPGGIISEVLIHGTAGKYVVSGDSIRYRLGGLRNNMFMVEPKYAPNGELEAFIFYGGGWGHGVGMCQSGAAGMAAAGYTYKDILNHYYPGAMLTKRY